MKLTVTDIINILNVVIFIGLLIRGRRFNSKWDNAIKDIRVKLDQGKNR